LNTHTGVYIHHNIIENFQGSGIAIYGFNNTIIENNVIEHNGQGDNRDFIDNVPTGKNSGITFYAGGDGNRIKGYTTYVRNNIIGNNAGYGVENKKPGLHTFVLEYNCVYNNQKGNYKNASSSTDIYVYPDFACDSPAVDDGRISYTYNILSRKWQEAIETGNFRGDFGAKQAMNVYHLRSGYGRWDGHQWVYDDVTSFCINAGDPQSDYSNEPLPNGGRINIGAFGNTPFASKGDEIPDIHTFIAYPNPTNGIITLSAEFKGKHFLIYSLTGTLIKSGTVVNGKIDLSGLPRGIYLIKVQQYKLNGWRSGKIIKL